ncbi:hypothetical protein [Candidatus Thiosymbion oneisti]|uniref:hypothetical protein n=1 Tax=Candidatus Thiosymbion oneisti TaxID=589554 RepID=UPI000B7E1ADE|nr:hypothetical protein [Candidatus Thiosymbion oneisti]
MGKRSDVVGRAGANALQNGMIYTRKCGWIDLGHARPDGARDLWDRVRFERGTPMPGNTTHIIPMIQGMQRFGVRVGTGSRFWIKKGLSTAQKERVALGIYLDVSEKFERLQSYWPFRWFTDSGFSAEDLVSNLIGFYRAVRPGPNYIAMCHPVSKEEALDIWDKFGLPGIHKNYLPLPFLFHRGSPVCAMLPPFLSSITPAGPGKLFGLVRK